VKVCVYVRWEKKSGIPDRQTGKQQEGCTRVYDTASRYLVFSTSTTIRVWPQAVVLAVAPEVAYHRPTIITPIAIR